MFASLFDLFSREHPALVHVPLGLVVCLPIMMAAAHRSRYPQTWRRMAFRVALLAMAASVLTIASGFYWARMLSLIPAGSMLPRITGQGQALQRLLRLHELTAVCGFFLGLICLMLLRKSYHEPEKWGWTSACLAGTLVWAGAWAFVGKAGGTMVFGNAETNRAAAAAIEAKKNDAEADLPIRALDYASLEPAGPAQVRSKAHGNRLARIWVTASGIDAFQAGKPLPTGAYAVMSTAADGAGTPGPLYMREVKADGTQAFAFYWPRVPEADRKQTGGEDFVYWRSPNPALEACAKCHATAGPAGR